MEGVIRKVPFYQIIDGLRVPGVFCPSAFRETAKFKPLPGDFFLDTFPKCGTTWTQQICYLIYNNGTPPQSAQQFFVDSPFIDMVGTGILDHIQRPVAIKSHLPYQYIPMSDQAKYLYVVRNPKDTLVSFYHHTRGGFFRFSDGKFDDYFEVFINGENDFGDYFDHVKGWYAHRNDPNVMFLTYEEMKMDTLNCVLNIAEFMGKQYRDRLEKDKKFLDDVLHYSSFQYMKGTFNDSLDEMFQRYGSMEDLDSAQIPSGFKHAMIEFRKLPSSKNDSKSHLIRKGVVGDWRTAFSEEQNKRMDERIESELGGTDLLKFWNKIGCLVK